MSLSTHVLDAARGRPARGLLVTLERRDGGRWVPVATGRTDHDGRVGAWVPEGMSALAQLPATGTLGAGDHRLVFATGDWFAAEGLDGFYPEVTVAFTVTSPQEHHHVPLLLSPFAYSTYRGS